VGLHFTAGSVGHIVDKYAESPNTEAVQVVEFFHEGIDSGSHIRFVGKTDSLFQSRVCSPNEVDITGFGLLGQRFQVVLGNHTEKPLLFGERGRIIVSPITEVVGI